MPGNPVIFRDLISHLFHPRSYFPDSWRPNNLIKTSFLRKERRKSIVVLSDKIPPRSRTFNWLFAEVITDECHVPLRPPRFTLHERSKEKFANRAKVPTSLVQNRACGRLARSSRAMYQFLSSSVFHPRELAPRHDLVLSARPLTRSAFVTQPRPACSPLSTTPVLPIFRPFLLSRLPRSRGRPASSGPQLDRAREARPLRGDTSTECIISAKWILSSGLTFSFPLRTISKRHATLEEHSTKFRWKRQIHDSHEGIKGYLSKLLARKLPTPGYGTTTLLLVAGFRLLSRSRPFRSETGVNEYGV